MAATHEEQILKALFDLHGSLVKSTVNMKDPDDLVALLNKFSHLSVEVQDYLDGNTATTNSKELSPIFSAIGDPSQLSPEAKTNCRNWTIMMFETYPTVINEDHMVNLMKNAATLPDGPATPDEDTEAL